MKVHFLSISLLTSIPSLRFIVDSFLDKNFRVAITELSIKNSNNYFVNKNIEHNLIAEFDNFDRLKVGLKKIAFKKYLTICKILLSKKDDLIYTNDFQVVFLKLLLNKKSKLIYHQFELIEPTFLGKIGNFVFKYVLKNANKIDLCIFPEQNRADYFINISKALKDKVMIFPNTCKLVTSNLVDEKSCIDFIPDSQFIVLHTGVLGVAEHYYDTFLRATQLFKKEDNVAFVFIGRKTTEIDRFIEENKITNIYFIANIPHQELLKVYKKANLGLILYKGVNLNIEYCAPNKLYEFWSNGIPVLAHTLQGLQPLFNNKVLGLLTDFSKEEIVYSTILNLKNSTDHFKEEVKKYFKENFEINIYQNELNNKIAALFTFNKN